MKTKAKSKSSLSLVFIVFMLLMLYLASNVPFFNPGFENNLMAYSSSIDDFSMTRVIEFVAEMVTYSL